MRNVFRLYYALQLFQEVCEDWLDDSNIETHYPEGLPSFDELVAQLTAWQVAYAEEQRKVMESFIKI